MVGGSLKPQAKLGPKLAAKLIRRHDHELEVLEHPAPARMPRDDDWPRDNDPRWFPAGALSEALVLHSR